MFIRSALLTLTLSLSALVLAEEPLVFESPEQEARYNELTMELRCTVCQNQSLADSDAPLAQDLREEIHNMMVAGQSNDQTSWSSATETSCSTVHQCRVIPWPCGCCQSCSCWAAR